MRRPRTAFLSWGKNQVNDSASAMRVGPGEKALIGDKVNDIQTWISSAVMDQETCLDGLEEMGSTAVDAVKSEMKKSMEYSSNSLAIAANFKIAPVTSVDKYVNG
ncbi:putative pectinesterase/pectinesterase inhibitor 26 [Malus sylvestris]|uniref:putative pectinesterase/pectinesterase inhibitor 26 n=1 Tax=Malus sylvestris TaxID=3752 RepID=UPI0021AD4450|nr:putative pectinesterase/pectinesterase inhibitor 26 [Malus sylvestris]